ncbi:hypothetical protein MUK42_35560 [Musa troglodytarum]|uniref:Secreted protein n=1 Tax=Musa troglodytarum TaxID=320322 RepID=A0A9E7H537_9LILI|nr:hypothetical protein MUK42_35560 [Musa troglodytarum]
MGVVVITLPISLMLPALVMSHTVSTSASGTGGSTYDDVSSLVPTCWQEISKKSNSVSGYAKSCTSSLECITVMIPGKAQGEMWWEIWPSLMHILTHRIMNI